MTYDQVGNMLSKGSRTFEWKLGRKLAKVTDEMTTASYEYDHTGNRVKKTVTEVDGTKVETAYHMAGDLLLSEKTGSQTIWFEYDSSANLVSMKTGGKRYFYIKNVQNDIVGLADANGNVVVRYQYDAWGKLLNIIGEIEIGVKNPFRYRGYYYDTETGMYYLKSRFYDPGIRRFVCADGVYTAKVSMETLHNRNLYSYCNENPIFRIDSNGKIWGIVAASFVVGTLASVGTQIVCGEKVDWLSAVSDGVGLSLSFLGANVLTQTIVSVAFNVAKECIEGNDIKTATRNIATDLALDTVVGFLGGKIINKFVGAKGPNLLDSTRAYNTRIHQIRRMSDDSVDVLSYLAYEQKKYNHTVKQITKRNYMEYGVSLSTPELPKFIG